MKRGTDAPYPQIHGRMIVWTARVHHGNGRQMKRLTLAAIFVALATSAGAKDILMVLLKEDEGQTRVHSQATDHITCLGLPSEFNHNQRANLPTKLAFESPPVVNGDGGRFGQYGRDGRRDKSDNYKSKTDEERDKQVAKLKSLEDEARKSGEFEKAELLHQQSTDLQSGKTQPTNLVVEELRKQADEARAAGEFEKSEQFEKQANDIIAGKSTPSKTREQPQTPEAGSRNIWNSQEESEHRADDMEAIRRALARDKKK